MSNGILNSQNFSVTSTKIVKEICQPLSQIYNISDFLYARVYDNDKCYALTTNKEYHEHHFKCGYKLTPIIPDSIMKQKFHYILSDYNNDNYIYTRMLYDLRHLFNLWFPFYLFERYEGYYDLYIFCSTPQNTDVLNFYLNNIENLELFKFYFKEKASELLKKAESNKITLPKHMMSNVKGLYRAQENNDKINKQIYNQIRKYCFQIFGKKILFTKREMDSLRLLLKGYSVKEIAANNNVSSRTIETHINNIKYKLGVSRKSKIVEILFRHNFPLF